MDFYKLGWQEYFLLFFMIIGVYLFTATQRYFIPDYMRPVALLIVAVSLLFFLFFRVKPKNPFLLSKFLSLLLGLIALIITIIEHVIITFNLSYNSAFVVGVTLLSPFIAGFLYKIIKK